MKHTKVIWTNKRGEERFHRLYGPVTYFYALNWWRESICECQGILTQEEKRNSKLKLLRVENCLYNDKIIESKEYIRPI